MNFDDIVFWHWWIAGLMLLTLLRALLLPITSMVRLLVVFHFLRQ